MFSFATARHPSPERKLKRERKTGGIDSRVHNITLEGGVVYYAPCRVYDFTNPKLRVVVPRSRSKI